MNLSSATENAFLGAIVGLAIGDALGLPVIGLTADQIATTHGAFTSYLASDHDNAEHENGMVSDKTETMLCLIESMTTNGGDIDPENVNARLGFLVDGPTRQWMSDQFVAAIKTEADDDGLVDPVPDGPQELAVGIRGIPVGLMHSIGTPDDDALQRDAALVARLTHGDPASAALVTDVARAVAIGARLCDTDETWPEILLSDHAFTAELRAIMADVRTAVAFEDVVYTAVRQGGEASARGAIAGGIAGAWAGAAGLPQHLIDDLDARIYLSMAAPWFYRTARARHGDVIPLIVDNGPR